MVPIKMASTKEFDGKRREKSKFLSTKMAVHSGKHKSICYCYGQ